MLYNPTFCINERKFAQRSFEEANSSLASHDFYPVYGSSTFITVLLRTRPWFQT